jgi:acyl-CoA synthetase (AMP-forming)/AMP-acid ligase II
MRGLGVREICNVYGATETYGNSSVTDAYEPPRIRCATQGRPLPGMSVKFAEEIRAFCRDNISSSKRPVYVVFRKAEDLPRTATGKVQKTKLREEMTALMRRGDLAAGTSPFPGP